MSSVLGIQILALVIVLLYMVIFSVKKLCCRSAKILQLTPMLQNLQKSHLTGADGHCGLIALTLVTAEFNGGLFCVIFSALLIFRKT